MPKAWLGELGARLPQIALAMLAAKQGGPEASAAFMGGLQQSADRRQALTRQAQLDEERRGAQAQQDARQDRQMTLQEQTLASQEARASVDDTRMAAADKQRRLSEALAYLDQYSQQMGATANDPVAAENAMLSRASMLEGPMGLPQGQLSPFLQPMAPVISARKQKQAEAVYARAEKMYGSEALANDSITLQTGELFGDVKPSQLRALFAPQAVTEAGQAVAPAVPGASSGASDLDRTYRRLREEFVSNYGRNPSPKEDVALDRKSREESKVVTPVDPNTTALRELNVELAKQRLETGAANVGALPPRRQSQVTIKQRSFDSAAVTKRVQTMAEAVTFTKNLDPNTNNAADDQGLIYAFAKAMDPESVVREGEYATVQKYAQAWAESMGFNAARVFSNTPFLTAQARRNMKATIASRFGATKQQYDNLRREYAGQIDKITGGTDGESYLVDYAAGFSGTGAPASGDDAYAEYLKRQNAR